MARYAPSVRHVCSFTNALSRAKLINRQINRAQGGNVIRKSLYILLLTLLSVTATQAKVFIVSDIDDTIKKANSSNGGIGQVYHFLRKKIYPEMRDLFIELHDSYEDMGEEVQFSYVSAAPDMIFDQDKWIAKHNFTAGEATLRSIGSGDTYTYKKRVIGAILDEGSTQDTYYFFGDNASKDAIVYKELVEERGLTNSFIYIRDVSTEATHWDDEFAVHRLEGVRYFFSERDLLEDSGLVFVSSSLSKLIDDAYREQSLIPEYTLKTLKKRIQKEWGCKKFDIYCRKVAKERASEFWADYYGLYN